MLRRGTSRPRHPGGVSGSLVLLVLVVVATVGVLPRWGGRPLPTGPWLLGWLAGTAGAVVLAFTAGVTHYDVTVCQAAVGDEGDCDLGALEGLLWAGATLGLLLVAWVVDAVRRARR